MWLQPIVGVTCTSSPTHFKLTTTSEVSEVSTSIEHTSYEIIVVRNYKKKLFIMRGS